MYIEGKGEGKKKGREMGREKGEDVRWAIRCFATSYLD